MPRIRQYAERYAAEDFWRESTAAVPWRGFRAIMRRHLEKESARDTKIC